MIEEKISIVIPVYNVIEYLDRCLSSVTNQTYSNLEIVLVNDGSTDGSEEKCQEWADRDRRISLISQENSGQGIARNVGINVATGTYLAFVDSDDWIELTMIEKLYRRIKQEDADIAICDIYHALEDENGTINSIPYKIQADIKKVTNANDLPEIVYRTDTCLYDKLYRSDFWREQDIMMPNHPYEDSVIVPLLMTLAKRVTYVPESLYHYNLHRGGNTTSYVKNLPYIRQSLEELIHIAKEKHIFEKNRETFKRYSIWMMKGIHYHLKKSRNREEYQTYYELTIPEMIKFMDENYPGWSLFSKQKFAIWGSYNLRSEVMHMLTNPLDLVEHYGFSSMIGYSDKPLDDMEFEQANSFRRDMIIKEWKRKFVFDLDNNSSEVDYLLVDLLEERHDILQFRDRLMTNSDALQEANIQVCESSTLDKNEVRVIHYRDQEHMRLWKEYVVSFFEELLKCYDVGQIVVVKNVLCDCYGKHSQKVFYSNKEEINCINQNIEERYRFIAEKFPNIKMIEPAPEYVYTDQDFIHGRKPEHMNELAYWNVSDQIENYILNRESTGKDMNSKEREVI